MKIKETKRTNKPKQNKNIYTEKTSIQSRMNFSYLTIHHHHHQAVNCVGISV